MLKLDIHGIELTKIASRITSRLSCSMAPHFFEFNTCTITSKTWSMFVWFIDQGRWIVLKATLFASKISFNCKNDSGLTSCPQKAKTNACKIKIQLKNLLQWINYRLKTKLEASEIVLSHPRTCSWQYYLFAKDVTNCFHAIDCWLNVLVKREKHDSA